MKSIFYKKNIHFMVKRFEEWTGDTCLSQGDLSADLHAEVQDDAITFCLSKALGEFLASPCIFNFGTSDILDDGILYFAENAVNNTPNRCQFFLHNDAVDQIRFTIKSESGERYVDLYGHLVKQQERSNRSIPSQQVLQKLIETVIYIQAEYARIGVHKQDNVRTLELYQMMETFKYPLYLAWELYGYGSATDFMKSEDAVPTYQVFKTKAADVIENLSDILREDSPFELLEKKSAITKALLAIYADLYRRLNVDRVLN